MSLHSFVHLRVHTEYSLLDSVVRVPELIAATAAADMPAVALTDECNLFAMVKFYRAALARGVKPIVGVDLWLREPGEREPPSRLTLLCQNEAGYLNLSRLVSRAYLEGERQTTPLIERAWLTPQSLAGLIALSGGREGDVGRALAMGRAAQAARLLQDWKALLGDRYYLELQRLGRPGDDEHVAQCVQLAGAAGVPVVATNDVRFLARADFDSHEARVCIHEGSLLADPARRRHYTREQYLRTPAQMAELFADVPEALANSVQIARRCSLVLKLGSSRLPIYPVPDGSDADEHIRATAAQGLEARWRAIAAQRGSAAEVPDEYRARLVRELDVICSMGFAGYFLIVADFIRWAKHNGVPVGPGRGSGAGSLVAWVLGITDLDPIEYDLLFERFLNPERVSMPDFDVDFCMEGRDRVIAYVADKYGRERVSQIITYGSMAAKAVVRDVGRVLGHPYGFVDRIAKLVPFELGITLKDALEKEPELSRLYRDDEEVKALIDLAQSLEGLTRNAGTHAGGVVIAPSVLTDFTPLFCEAGSASVVTQFDKDDVEAAGLVKFDFLGLRTLTIIDRAVKIIDSLDGGRNGPLDLNALPLDDPATYALLKSGQTTAVFQLESRGMKDLIRRLKPDRFEDVVALVALFRPGPLQSGMVDDFIARKNTPGTAIDYLHPSLQGVLEPTYGVILYQEQVMQIAQVLSGYTLGGADLLRRAMGKKKAEEMAKQRSGFVDGAVQRGIDGRQAAYIFDLIEKFAGYGFNKSHSAAYALLSYQTAWLKTHHPAAFMAAVLSADIDNTDKVVTLVDECERLGLAILPPQVNASAYSFSVEGAKAIRYGLGAIRGVGEQAVQMLVAEREAHGPYTDLEQLCRRIDLTRVNRRVLEALIKSGALDGLGTGRAELMSRLDAAVLGGEQSTRASAAGQEDLFGTAPVVVAPAAAVAEWSEALRLAGERETLGLYLTGHPIQRFESELPRLVSGRLADIANEPPPAGGEAGRYYGGRVVSVAGLICDIRRRNGRTSFMLDDRTGRIEVTLFEEQLQQFRDLVVKDTLVLVEGNLRYDEFSAAWRVAGRRLVLLDALREQQARRLLLRWPAGSPSESQALVGKLKALLAEGRPGSCEVLVRYEGSGARCTLALGRDWSVRLTPALMDQLESLVGREGLQLLYEAPVSGSLHSAAPGT
ncbi:MAG: DNA polymerase III subunit alpha [Steroidobacteraceae bacterium]